MKDDIEGLGIYDVLNFVVLVLGKVHNAVSIIQVKSVPESNESFEEAGKGLVLGYIRVVCFPEVQGNGYENDIVERQRQEAYKLTRNVLI